MLSDIELYMYMFVFFYNHVTIFFAAVTYQILHPTIHEYPAQYKKFPVHDTVMDVLRKVKCRHTLVSDYTCDISLEKKVTEITEPIVFSKCFMEQIFGILLHLNFVMSQCCVVKCCLCAIVLASVEHRKFYRCGCCAV